MLFFASILSFSGFIVLEWHGHWDVRLHSFAPLSQLCSECLLLHLYYVTGDHAVGYTCALSYLKIILAVYVLAPLIISLV
jgi:hypothetical protein